MNQTAKCDECEQVFEINLETEERYGGIEVTAFSCPECEHVYVVSVADDVSKGIQEEVRGIWGDVAEVGQAYRDGQISEPDFRKQIDKLNVQINEKKKEFKERSAMLMKEI